MCALIALSYPSLAPAQANQRIHIRIAQASQEFGTPLLRTGREIAFTGQNYRWLSGKTEPPQFRNSSCNPLLARRGSWSERCHPCTALKSFPPGSALDTTA